MRNATTKNSHIWVILSSILLVICIILTGMVITDHRMERNREEVYMRTIYYDLQDIANQAQLISQMDSFDGDRMFALYHLRMLLMQTDKDFSKDASYLTGETPSAFGIWFSQQSSEIDHLCDSEPVNWEKIKEFMLNLQTNAEKLYQPFTGEDGRNFDNTIMIEEFTATMSDVHDQLSAP